jgi:hypothetical protein
MALYRHLASGTTPGEMWTFSLFTNGTLSLTAAHSAWQLAVETLWVGGIDAQIANEVVLTGFSTAEIDPTTGRQSQRVDTGVNYPGASTGEMLPFQCATAVSLRTTFATRSGRGRFFLPPLAVTAVAGGRLATAAQTLILGQAVDMMSTLSTTGAAPVVYSRVQHIIQAVVSIDVGDVIDTQRRRRNKLVEERLSSPI